MVYKNPDSIKKKFSCTICDYSTCSRKDFIKHIKTKISFNFYFNMRSILMILENYSDDKIIVILLKFPI